MYFRQVVVLVLLGTAALGFRIYQPNIPNGGNVKNPCDGSAWNGVGHENPAGGGLLNPFGMDFRAVNHMWTADLCSRDSDGDGMTNGQELGDSNCDWTPGGPVDPVMGNPGICEPVGSSRCSFTGFTCVVG